MTDSKWYMDFFGEDYVRELSMDSDRLVLFARR